MESFSIIRDFLIKLTAYKLPSLVTPKIRMMAADPEERGNNSLVLSPIT